MKITTILLTICAAIAVLWAILSDLAWLGDNALSISLIIGLLALCALLGYRVGYEQGRIDYSREIKGIWR